MHPRVIKEVTEELVEPLRIIFEISLQEGEMPEDWKIAYITPIHKKGDKSDPGNYRPISLTNVFSKLMESLLREEIMTHMNKYRLFSNRVQIYLRSFNSATDDSSFGEMDRGYR